MEDYPVIGLVLMVVVSLPAARFNMDFYVSLYQPAAGGNNGVTEVSTPVIIHPSRIDYLYCLTTFSGQLGSVQ